MKPRTKRNSWLYFFTCRTCHKEIEKTLSEKCCGIPGNLWSLGFLLEDRSCWARYAIVIALLSLLLFLAAKLLLGLWKSIRYLFVEKNNSKDIKRNSKTNMECVTICNSKGTYENDPVRIKNFPELQCADRDDYDMQSARSYVTNSIEPDYEPESIQQNPTVIIDTKPYTVLSEHQTSTEYAPPTRQVSFPIINNISQITESDENYNRYRSRQIPFPDYYNYPDPYDCNYLKKSSCWGSEYLPKYNINLNRDFNDFNCLPYRYDVNTLRPNYPGGSYQPKSLHENQSVEFLYSRTEDICPNNIVTRLRTSLSKLYQQYKPTHYPPTHWIGARSSPGRYSHTPERSQDIEHYKNDYQLNAWPEKNVPSRTQLPPNDYQARQNQNANISLSSIYLPENSQQQKTLLENHNKHRNKNIHSKEKIKATKQTEMNVNCGLAGTSNVQANDVEPQRSKNLTRPNGTTVIHENTLRRRIIQQNTSSRNSNSDKERIRSTNNKQLIHQQNNFFERTVRESKNSLREIGDQQQAGSIGKKLFTMHKQKRSEPQKGTIHKLICKFDPKVKQLQSKQTDLNYQQAMNLPRKVQDSPRSKSSLLTRTDPEKQFQNTQRQMDPTHVQPMNITKEYQENQILGANQPPRVEPQNEFQSTQTQMEPTYLRLMNFPRDDQGSQSQKESLPADTEPKKQLQSTATQIEPTYLRLNKFLKDKDKRRTRDYQPTRVEPGNPEIISSEEDKVTYNVGTTENLQSDSRIDIKMNVNQPKNIRPELRLKSKKLSKAKQSPVDIQMKNCLPLYFEDPLTWYSYNSVPLSMTISNWNDTVALNAVWNVNETPCLSGGPMFSDVYRFDKLIFKWGASDSTGSEHSTDGKFYSLERQMVFRLDGTTKSGESSKTQEKVQSYEKNGNQVGQWPDTKSRGGHLNKTFSKENNDRKNKEDNNLEYVIISSFYEIFEVDPYSRNESLDNILKYVNAIQYPNTSYTIPMFSLDEIQQPFNCDYFSYFGSLTVPSNAESVLWIIQPDISFVSKDQLANFRSIKSENGDNVLSNRRPIQQMNKRRIYLCC